MPSQRSRQILQVSAPPLKRRKVRKGTQSCWECKRRKVRCLYALPINAACDNCIRRKDKCVSQEFVEEPDKETKDADSMVESRLSRVEGLLGQLASHKSIPSEHLLAADSACPQPAASQSITNAIDFSLSSPGDCVLVPTPDPISGNESLHHRAEPRDVNPFEGHDISTIVSTTTSRALDYTGLAKDLVAVWPSPQELDDIYKIRIGPLTQMHMKMCTPPTKFTNQGPAMTPQADLQLPPPGSHPVLIARKLLVLGSLLQGAFSRARISLQPPAKYKAIMFRVLDAAIRLVTTNDALTASIEGIECVMIEAMIQNNAGDLHKSWMTVRRAAAIAQVIGLHRTSKSSSLRFVDSKNRAGCDTSQLYFRIVEMDRYLSITLGLPRSSLAACAVTAEALAGFQPLDRLARQHCFIAGCVIDLVNEDLQAIEPSSIHEIDQLLQKATNEMPPQWWMMPSSRPEQDDDLESSHIIPRYFLQFTHFQLVLRLHLPFVLRPSVDDAYSSSRVIAVNASREILNRYIDFRQWHSGDYYCRGVDFLAFIALTVLCMAHIRSRNSFEDLFTKVLSNVNTWGFLLHSRPSDRGIMERTFAILEGMERDAIAQKLSPIMRHLLEVEANAASGTSYSTEATGEEAFDWDSKLEQDRGVLQLHMPYVGTIIFQRMMGPRASGCTTDGNTHVSNAANDDAGLLGQRGGGESHPQAASCDGQWLQGVEPWHIDLSAPNNDPQSVGRSDLDTPEDWTLQNINEGLFSSLFSGLDYYQPL